jgi:hypothetical protein
VTAKLNDILQGVRTAAFPRDVGGIAEALAPLAELAPLSVAEVPASIHAGSHRNVDIDERMGIVGGRRNAAASVMVENLR